MPGKPVDSSRWGWLAAAVTVLAAAGTGYKFALAEQWVGLMLLSIGFPASALITWYQQRQHGAAAGQAADQMLVPFALVEVFLFVLLETGR